jgi:hypothetical protein
MPYSPMPLQLETARLSLRPWSESDVDAHRVLVGERGGGMPSVEDNRRMIEDQRAASALTGIALLPVIRRDVGDFIGYCGLTVGRASVDEPDRLPAPARTGQGSTSRRG